jgi:hypothetical protein
MITSYLARDSIDTTALENLVYETVMSFGLLGCISDEIRARHPHLAYSSITARYYNLEKQGRIIRPGSMRPGRSGRMQAEIWADKFAKQLIVIDDPEGLLRDFGAASRQRIKDFLHV